MEDQQMIEQMRWSERDLRMRALQLAATSCSHGSNSNEIVRHAARFLAFVNGEEVIEVTGGGGGSAGPGAQATNTVGGFYTV